MVVSSFLRPGKLRRCLDSLARIPEEHGPDKVVVVDDSGSEDIDGLCDDFPGRPDIDLNILPYNSGLSKKRNEGIGKVDTDYVLLLDDDQYVPSNIYELVGILENNPDLGGVAPYWEEDGWVRSNAADYRVSRGWVLKDVFEEKVPEETGTGSVMYRYDHIPNSAMYRRQVFEDYSWDDFYVIEGEDTDFYLKHMELGVWEFAVTPDYIVRHDPGPGELESFLDERRDAAKLRESFDYLTDKFGVKGVIQKGCHVPPRRGWSEKAARAVVFNLVPRRVVWWLRRRQFGYALVDRFK